MHSLRDRVRFRGAIVVGLALSAGGCGASSRPEASVESRGYTSGSAAEAESDAPGERGSLSPPPPQTDSTGSAASSGSGAEVSQLASWQSQLEAAERSLGASDGACGEVCRASGDICTAAREICSLTGDGDVQTPSDPRCGRARTACERASRQRDGACPRCPADR